MPFYSVFATTESRGMGVYEVPLSMCVGFWDGDYVIQLPYVWYYVGVKSCFNMLVRNASPRGYLWFRCLIFS